MLNTGQFIRQTLIVFAIALALITLWYLSGFLVMVFGGIVVAVIIRAGGELIARYLPFLEPRWGSVLFVLLSFIVLAGLSVFTGDEIAKQFGELRERLPEAIATVRTWLESNEFGRFFMQSFAGAKDEGVSASEAMKTASATVGAVSHAVIVFLIALYLSFGPAPYINGFVALVPEPLQADTRAAFEVSGQALRGWLLGQGVAMLAVGVLTYIGLWIAGVPLAFILGIIAGLLEFIPVLGPFLAAIPGLLLAFTVGPTTALYALIVYVTVQQLESIAITPLAQKWSVELPPALCLFAIVVFGLLFGIPGMVFATPLTVVLMALVKRFHTDRPV